MEGTKERKEKEYEGIYIVPWVNGTDNEPPLKGLKPYQILNLKQIAKANPHIQFVVYYDAKRKQGQETEEYLETEEQYKERIKKDMEDLQIKFRQYGNTENKIPNIEIRPVSGLFDTKAYQNEEDKEIMKELNCIYELERQYGKMAFAGNIVKILSAYNANLVQGYGNNIFGDFSITNNGIKEKDKKINLKEIANKVFEYIAFLQATRSPLYCIINKKPKIGIFTLKESLIYFINQYKKGLNYSINNSFFEYDDNNIEKTECNIKNLEQQLATKDKNSKLEHDEYIKLEKNIQDTKAQLQYMKDEDLKKLIEENTQLKGEIKSKEPLLQNTAQQEFIKNSILLRNYLLNTHWNHLCNNQYPKWFKSSFKKKYIFFDEKEYGDDMMSAIVDNFHAEYNNLEEFNKSFGSYLRELSWTNVKDNTTKKKLSLNNIQKAFMMLQDKQRKILKHGLCKLDNLKNTTRTFSEYLKKQYTKNKKLQKKQQEQQDELCKIF